MPSPLLPPPVDLGDLLQPFARRGVDLGLERLAGALAEGDHPERRFAAAQVAGTNGKGSICTFLHAILRAAGVHVGTYRSPHLVSWCERIQVDDAWIPPASLRDDLARWQPIGRRHRLTPFELITAAAFDHFARERVDLAVLEVGLGGRLDATTAHPHRPVIGFGTIGLDHREHLGDTLAAIAAEKAAVMGPGCRAFSAAQEPEARRVLEAEARQRGASLQWLEPLPAVADGGPHLGLAGELQRHNGAVAVAMARALTAPDGPLAGTPLDAAAIRAGLAAARWPGRLERHRWRGRELLIDGAHNPPAAAALRRELDRLEAGPRRWLLGIQRHKEGAVMLEQLLRPGDRAAVVAVPEHVSWTLEELAAACPGKADQLEPAGSLAAGLDSLLPAGPLPVVAGSLFLLGAVLPLFDAPEADEVPGAGQPGGVPGSPGP
ncbi:bifunctional folylpolyglutamate synthase/dihydrofolate synthase [Cyanobium sp. Copco_Reservoir_LC18]|uniref:bifunctional folylpolyglutamate synthase/dihydrofolate synthase n=1 Tax=Cyanobium sp. Copco_Reservoir_LC18 TaxID=1328305 RepID=UPI00135BEEBE|nr:Mur ligase family protein [Cyanobium sp. Copco_Reservoir_LC18]KAF0654944.1 bifunctional folylpolyglutamate synthase/dihydrofolate synthase [Cyanobium sp. Copco_Reservoir_LC18]